MSKNIICVIILLSFSYILPGQKKSLNDRITSHVNKLTEESYNLYTDLHKNPELSHMETKTSARMAEELKKIGFEVTTGIGGNGVVGVFRNGKGKVVMFRTDMDALPVKENTGLPFASSVIMKDSKGVEYPVMHACGHDFHMTAWLGTLNTLVAMKAEWKGTIIAIAQPAEEMSDGAKAMINDGLFKKFPVPDYILAFHVSAELPAGTIGYCPGPIFAGVNSADITVFGRGGHGALPHMTIDPVVISARIVLDLQTIISREINPVKPAVVTVGAIHGGSKHNVIPDEVKMLLTIRFFEDEVYLKIRESILKIARGAAISAGVPEDKMPLIVFDEELTSPVINDNDLTERSVGSMKSILGDEKVIRVDPATVAEDFGKYGLTDENIPIALFWLGGVNNEKYLEHTNKGTPLPSLHNSGFVPEFQPAFITGSSAMSKTIINLMEN